ncbi:hypothetical protein MRB53_040801 [Persea americana]|nr:hypothetical protein MRB53_040801 [Persea americana]
MASAKQSKLAPSPSRVSPPCISRQTSYITAGTATSKTASAYLARISPSAMACRSPQSETDSTNSSLSNSPNTSYRESWQSCDSRRPGYVSFPDFDTLHEKTHSQAG